jgi:hypothetical protein
MEAAGATCSSDPSLRLRAGAVICQNVDPVKYKNLLANSRSPKVKTVVGGGRVLQAKNFPGGKGVSQAKAPSSGGRQAQQDLCPPGETLIDVMQGPESDSRTLPVCKMSNGNYLSKLKTQMPLSN